MRVPAMLPHFEGARELAFATDPSNAQKAMKIAGGEEQWNELEIIWRGPEVRMTIAGQSVNRFNQLRVQPGVIGFESPEKAPEGFTVRFRDVGFTPGVKRGNSSCEILFPDATSRMDELKMRG